VHTHLRGVDDEIRRAGNRLEQLALGGDRVAQTDVAGDQGMLAAGLGIAIEQHLVRGVQVNHLAADAAAPQLADQRRNGLDFIGPVARVQTDRGSGIGVSHAADGVRDEGLEQRRRDIVDAIEIDVLEHVQRHALARARQPAHDDQSHRHAGSKVLNSTIGP